MLIGGLSKTMSVTGPRTRTWRRSAIAALQRQQVADGLLERDTGATAGRAVVQDVDREQHREEPRDRIRDRRSPEARRIVAGRPAPTRFGREAVARAFALG